MKSILAMWRSLWRGDEPESEPALGANRAKPTLPPLSILNNGFRYRDSAHTNTAATFNRIRKQMKEAKEAEAEARSKVRPISERKKA